MIVSLKNYTFPEFTPSEIIFRKAEQDDAALELFVKKEFGNGWLAPIENGFQEENIPIYAAVVNGMIVGLGLLALMLSEEKKDYLVQWVHLYQSVFME